MLEDIVAYLGNVEVRSFDGLLVDFVHQCNANVVVRGSVLSQTLSMSFRWPRPIGLWRRISIRFFDNEFELFLFELHNREGDCVFSRAVGGISPSVCGGTGEKKSGGNTGEGYSLEIRRGKNE